MAASTLRQQWGGFAVLRLRMIASVGLLVTVLSLLPIAFGPLRPEPASAWCQSFLDPPGGPYPVVQPDPTRRIFVRSSNMPSTWASQLDASRQAWNAQSHQSSAFLTMTLGWAGEAKPFETQLASFKSMAFPQIPGRLAPTISNPAPGIFQLTAGIVYMNSDFAWSTTGTMDLPNLTADVRTVATHEYGHILGITHPSDCGQNYPNPVMEPTNATKWTLRTDDINALRSLHPE